MVRLGEGESFVMADIPGLIEGAGDGVGLGHEFLSHTERTRLILHLVDVSGSEGRDPYEDFITINNELKKYSEDLYNREQIVVANKTDLVYDEEILKNFEKKINDLGYKVFFISGAIRKNVNALMKYTLERLKDIPPFQAVDVVEPDSIIRAESDKFTVKKLSEGVFEVEGDLPEKLINSTNFTDYESLQYLQRALIKSGIVDALREKGAQEGDTVIIDESQFDFVD